MIASSTRFDHDGSTIGGKAIGRQRTGIDNRRLPLALAALEFSVNCLADEIKTGFPVGQKPVDPGDGIGGKRQYNAFSPKFFASHVIFHIYDIDDGGNISYI